MIYICTVHFKTEVWLGIQLPYIKKNFDGPHRVFACVPEGRRRKDCYLEVSFEPQNVPRSLDAGSYDHAQKLNYLANLVCQEARPDDIIVFLDGDAFPIAPVREYLEVKLSQHKFLAVQRRENVGDIQPHPSFAATTVGFWTEIRGDWSPGFRWRNSEGQDVTDTGGNLLYLLMSREELWYPMLRTNRVNLHPLWFGIYDGVVYHHGAGYRPPVSRVDLSIARGQGVNFDSSPQFNNSIRLQYEVMDKLRKDFSFYQEFV